MNLLKQMRISGKVGLIIAMFSALCLMQITFGVLNLRDANVQVLKVMERSQQRSQYVSTLRWGVVDAYKDAIQIAVTEGETTALDRRLQGDRATIAKALRVVEKHMPAENAGMIGEIDHAITDYNQFITDYLAQREAGHPAEALQLLRTRGDPLYNTIFNDLEKLSAGMRSSRVQQVSAAADRAANTLWFIVACSVLACAAVAGAALVFLRRGISAPLKAITHAMNRLAEGDLDTPVAGADRGDEVGDLARASVAFRQSAMDKQKAEAETADQRRLHDDERDEHSRHQAAIAAEQTAVVSALADALSRLAAGELAFRLNTHFPPAYDSLRIDFNDAMGRLHDAMSFIARSAQSIQAGAGDISSSAGDLSQRTGQQAASLEETAAALSLITTAGLRAAEGASEATTAVAAVRTDAEESGQVVRDTVEAISQIQNSARQVTQIISVIDEIAFQTNLLALNAGVEAARAGEAGRGFAVVATEVRALAQRSAVAAKEIKVLISTSTDQVDSGVKLVGQTGEALERIRGNVNEIHALIVKIAASSRDQASGLHEVNGAIDQMDRATQRNAAMVQENTAASFALAEESQQLAQLLARFDLGDKAAMPQPSERNANAQPPEGRRHAPALRSIAGRSAAGVSA